MVAGSTFIDCPLQTHEPVLSRLPSGCWHRLLPSSFIPLEHPPTHTPICVPTASTTVVSNLPYDIGRTSIRVLVCGFPVNVLYTCMSNNDVTRRGNGEPLFSRKIGARRGGSSFSSGSCMRKAYGRSIFFSSFFRRSSLLRFFISSAANALAK